MQPEANHDLLMRYLLGDLSESDREQVEQEYFANDETWEILQEMESSLMDSYVRGGLDERQHRQFESYFLRIPGNRERVAVARCLMDPALREEFAGPDTPLPPPPGPGQAPALLKNQPSRWIIPLAAIALAASLLAAFLGAPDRHGLSQLGGPKPPQTRPPIAPSGPGEEVRNPGELSPSEIAHAFRLEPGVSRSASNAPQKLTVSEKSVSVVLELDLARDNYPQYDVALQTAEGRKVWSVPALKSRPISNGKGKAIYAAVPSQKLAAGEYIVQLYALGKRQPLESYMLSTTTVQ